MAVLKLPRGTTPTVSANAASRDFTSYGQSVSAQTVQFTAVSRKTTVLLDPEGPSSVSIVTPPAYGRAVARKDGNISLDLSGVDSTEPLLLVYDRTVDGQTTRVNATVTLQSGEKQGGWDRGAWYGLEVDPTTDRLIVEPAPNTRRVYIAENGLTAEDIAARETGLASASQVSVAWLQNTLAQGTSDFYGSQPELALHEALGIPLFRTLTNEEFSSPWALFRRGDSFTKGASLNGVRGYSRLYPAFIGSYGSGPLPRFLGDAFERFGSYPYAVVAQDIDYDQSIALNNGQFAAFDNLKARCIGIPPGGAYPLTSQGINGWQRAITLRRVIILDAVRTAPNNGREVWDVANGDRASGLYFARMLDGLVEKCFVDMAGWSFGYRADRSASFPKSPEDRSHAIYEQGSCARVTKRDLILTRASHSAMQNRSGGIVERVFAAGGNTGINPANSKDARPDGVNVDYGNWNLMLDYVQTVAGHKDFFDSSKPDLGFLGVIAGGISNGSPRFSIARSVVAHGGQGRPLTGPDDIGPVGAAGDNPNSYFAYRHVVYGITDQIAEPYYEDIKVYEWNSNINANIGVEGLDVAVLDATTIGAFTDQWKGVTGSDLNDFCAALRLEAAPWEQLAPVLTFFQTGFGVPSTTRTTAQTVTFQPATTGHTPGVRADMRDDWNTGDLPGSVENDSIDLDGHHIHWNITPARPIADVSFGDGGKMTMLGGALRPTGQVVTAAGGNSLSLYNGAKFDLPGFAATDPLHVWLRDARLINTGAVTGPMSIDAGFMSEVILGSDTGMFTLQPGQNITVHGTAKVGFEGSGGTRVSCEVSSGATLSFVSGLRLRLTGLEQDSFSGAAKLPAIGSTVTGLNGATGRVVDRIQTSRFDCYIVLDTLSGTFVTGDPLSSSETETGLVSEGAAPVGTVSGPVTYTLGQLCEFATGHRGQRAPDIDSQVVLGGTLHLDLTGVSSGTHTLIDVDRISGSFETIEAKGLGARDLVVTTTARQLQIEILSGGSGQIL